MAERISDQPLLAANAMWTEFAPLTADATLVDAGNRLAAAEAELLPVMDGGRLLGAVSARELAVAGCGAGLDPAATPVTEVMKQEPLWFTPDTPAAEALAQLHRRQLPAALVKQGHDEVVGVVSVHRLYGLLAAPPEGPLPDAVRRVRGEPY